MKTVSHNVSSPLRLALVALASMLMVGCASTRIPKDMVVSPEVMQDTRDKLAIEVGYHSSAYQQALRMGARGYCSSTYPIEPFVVMSTGYIDDHVLPVEKRAAYATLGVDEQVRVVWADPTVTPNVKVGDIVKEINGRKMDGDDENSLFAATRRGSLGMKAGESFKVELKDGTKLIIEGKEGCEAGIYGSFLSTLPYQMGFNLSPAFKVPTNLLAQARTADEQMWLAAFASYLTSSPEAESRRFKARVALTPVLATGVFLTIVPGGSWLTNKTTEKTIMYFGMDGIENPAAEYATREVHELGGDAARGIELFAQAQAKKLQVGDMVFTEEQLNRARKLAADLRSGTAAAPSYELPKR